MHRERERESHAHAHAHTDSHPPPQPRSMNTSACFASHVVRCNHETMIEFRPWVNDHAEGMSPLFSTSSALLFCLPSFCFAPLPRSLLFTLFSSPFFNLFLKCKTGLCFHHLGNGLAPAVSALICLCCRLQCHSHFSLKDSCRVFPTPHFAASSTLILQRKAITCLSGAFTQRDTHTHTHTHTHSLSLSLSLARFTPPHTYTHSLNSHLNVSSSWVMTLTKKLEAS